MILCEWSRERGESSVPAWLSLAQGRAKDSIRWLVQVGLEIVGTIGSTSRRTVDFWHVGGGSRGHATTIGIVRIFESGVDGN